ncbi:hypothetical protein [Mycobacteroides franklinii]|uniref:Uncharacterized protein n=1 Tax=Mycobacteroides franklinii TaxID=948102 RepID=A0A4R5PGP7_9MYCO|nr:hypothetical protein [Mycobacteroides franklinii]TDH25864.1 hypothetical protein EJ571_00730 [Mycobacteroides franklinii]
MKLRWIPPTVAVMSLIASLVIAVSCGRTDTNCPNGEQCTSEKNAPGVGVAPADNRKRAGRLVDAVERCKYDIEHSDPPQTKCDVFVTWDNNRKISYQDAQEEAKILQRKSLVDAINAAAQPPTQGICKPQLACNYYLGQLGIILDIPYFRENRYTADQMNSFLNEASIAGKSGNWLKVGEGIEPGSGVQTLANEGRFIVASSHSIPGVGSQGAPPCDPQADVQAHGESLTCHGHVAIAAPDYLDKESDPDLAGRRGPWIRYAILNGTPHTAKSTRTSKTFGPSVTPPIWVEYIGKDWHAPVKEFKPPCVDLDGDGKCDNLPSGGPNPPKPTPVCVACDQGYHCEHNPERCVRDSTTPVVTTPPISTPPSVSTTTTTTTPQEHA